MIASGTVLIVTLFVGICLLLEWDTIPDCLYGWEPTVPAPVGERQVGAESGGGRPVER